MGTTSRTWNAALRDRALFAGAGAAVCAGLLAWRIGGRDELGALLIFGAMGSALSCIDIELRRLPDALTLPMAALVLALFALADPHQAVAAACAAVGLCAFYGVQWFIWPTQIGFGDVKYALSVGAVLGWFGLSAVLTGVVVIHVLAAVWTLGRVALGGARRGAVIPFGPFMTVGALLTVLLVA